MKDWMKAIVREFLDNNWNAFTYHCQSHGDEKMANEIIVALGGEPDDD